MMTIPSGSRAGLLLSLFPLMILLAAACGSIRPVEKIGLIAPFEGLYRRSGYEALEAVRQTLASRPASDRDILPLALDNSGDPIRTHRAAQKLAVDPAVVAVIGPLSPAMTAALPAEIEQRFALHIAPYAVDPDGGFADPAADHAWATELLKAVGGKAQSLGARGLALAGPDAGWPAMSLAAWSETIGVPVTLLADGARPEPDEALFWRGDAADGASYLNALRAEGLQVQFWLGPAGGDPVFAEHAETFAGVYWATWTDLEYNRWKVDRSPASPQAYLVYRATEAVTDQLAGEAISPSPWQVAFYSIDDAGVSVPFFAE